jgi:hypothetical protein
MTDLDKQPNRNITNAEHPEPLVTQEPNASEPLLVWEDVRQAAAQPRK